MDMLQITSNYRTELLAFVKTKLNDSDYMWVRNFLTAVNKKAIMGNDDYTASRIILMYSGMTRFLRDEMKHVTPGGILYSFFICGVELGILTVNDPVLSRQTIVDEIEEEGIQLLTKADVYAMDAITQTLLLRKYLGDEAAWEESFACGLISIHSLVFYKHIADGL